VGGIYFATGITVSASTLIIPVENQVRELDAKLFLASVAAERGFPVVLGSRAFVHYRVASIPRGVYLAKSMRKLSNRMFSILRELGHEIVALDEEGLVRFAGEEYYRRRLSPGTVTKVSQLMAWGEDSADALRQYPDYHGAPIHVTGNPRIDLMRPELREFYRPDADSIREQYGDFVLINTNFGQINHFYADLGEMKAAVEGRGPDADNPFDVGWGRLKVRLFEAFLTMLPALCSAFPKQAIVLRPQPSEIHEPWQAIAAQHPNLHVINQGSVVPWLLAARALVANGCTTLIEAAVLDLPAVNFCPLSEPGLEDPLPQQFGTPAGSVDQVIAILNAVLAGDQDAGPSQQQQQLLAHNIAALSGPFAAERMVGVLVAAGYDQQQPAPVPLSRYLQGWLHTRSRTVKKRINMHRPGHRNNVRYHDHRFPAISVIELQRRIDRLGTLTGRFSGIRIQQTSRHVYRIDPPAA
jgi:surface carbohydrate biosynthesis protein